MSGFRLDALNNFEDREYREAFTDEFLNIWIATQIKVLREDRDWTQQDLAEKAGMRQSRISALESAGYASWSISTLKRLATAFDVTLNVEFKSYGDRLEDFERFEAGELTAAPFAEDTAFQSRPLEGALADIDLRRNGIRWGEQMLMSAPGPGQILSEQARQSGRGSSVLTNVVTMPKSIAA